MDNFSMVDSLVQLQANDKIDLNIGGLPVIFLQNEFISQDFIFLAC